MTLSHKQVNWLACLVDGGELGRRGPWFVVATNNRDGVRVIRFALYRREVDELQSAQLIDYRNLPTPDGIAFVRAWQILEKAYDDLRNVVPAGDTTSIQQSIWNALRATDRAIYTLRTEVAP